MSGSPKPQGISGLDGLHTQADGEEAEQQAGGRADEVRLYVHPGANEGRDRALSRTVKIQPELDDDAKQHEPARMATIADILHGPPDEQAVQQAGEPHVPLGLRAPPPDPEPDGRPQQQEQHGQAPARQVFAKQAVEHRKSAQVEQQVPSVGVGQIACYDAPPFALGDQVAIEGEQVVRYGEEEQGSDERKRDDPEQTRFF
ncbi:hypothetical protein D3C85_401580 [compost metagenome]